MVFKVLRNIISRVKWEVKFNHSYVQHKNCRGCLNILEINNDKNLKIIKIRVMR